MAVLSKAEVPPWGLAIAGSTGAVLANALVYPLDIVKTRLQVQIKEHASDTPQDAEATNHKHYNGTMHAIMSIVEDEGVRGLYSGMAGGLLGVASTNFAYFYWYSTVRTLYLSRVSKGVNPSTAVELSLGAMAGALAQLFTIPISVVTTRQQTQRSLLGALSKSLATMVTQPLIVAKVGLQSRPPPARKGKPFKSFLEVMRFIIEKEGPLGLYKGVAPQLLKGLLVQGILMMTKERVELLFILLFRYVRKVRKEKLEQLAAIAAKKIEEAKVAMTSK
ncbi:ADP/ATP carrier protein [Friedmanniomyces endolithicus]|uniref:ADP/ATP carrier protein n=1 Tax=Friedmanniomyces endolithicus TaxID=329885 RepID=A0AAN6JXU3_9PEZI|nr:ADP/ATP carrier protein [Friedmanniomyces endolithicus]